MATSFNLGALPLTWPETEDWLEQFTFYLTAAAIRNTNAKAVFFAHCGAEAYAFVNTAIRPLALSQDVVTLNDA